GLRGHVVRRQHAEHALHRKRLGVVDVAHPCMRHRRQHQAADHHAVHAEILRVLRLAGDLAVHVRRHEILAEQLVSHLDPLNASKMVSDTSFADVGPAKNGVRHHFSTGSLQPETTSAKMVSDTIFDPATSTTPAKPAPTPRPASPRSSNDRTPRTGTGSPTAPAAPRHASATGSPAATPPRS